MKKLVLSFVFGCLSFAGFAQVEKGDEYLQQPDTISMKLDLPDVYIDPKQAALDAEFRKQFLILQRRVYKVYPYAKTAATRLTGLNAGMDKMKSSKEKRKYQKIVEKYLKEQFEPQLKKLSRKDGQILVKLIHRQTGSSTYDLIKEYKSGWKAFWSNNTAKVFDINLRTTYQPMVVNQDYLIETILTRAFASGRLEPQAPAFPIDYEVVQAHWEKLVAEQAEKKANKP